MRRFSRHLVVLALALMATPALAAYAADYEIPPALQISIFLKVLVYDRSLATRARDGLELGIVYASHSDASRSCKDEFLKAFKESPRTVAGTEIHTIEVPEDALESEAERGLDMIYVCGGVNASPVADIAHKKGLITFAPDESAVQKGVSIGLVPRDGKPKLLINVNSSIASGMNLDPQILRLAELVRGEK